MISSPVDDLAFGRSFVDEIHDALVSRRQVHPGVITSGRFAFGTWSGWTRTWCGENPDETSRAGLSATRSIRSRYPIYEPADTANAKNDRGCKRDARLTRRKQNVCRFVNVDRCASRPAGFGALCCSTVVRPAPPTDVRNHPANAPKTKRMFHVTTSPDVAPGVPGAVA